MVELAAGQGAVDMMSVRTENGIVETYNMAAVSGRANYYRVTDALPTGGLFRGGTSYQINVRIGGVWLVADQTLNPGNYFFDGFEYLPIALSTEDVQTEINRLLTNRPEHVLLTQAAYNALSPRAPRTLYLVSG